MKTHFSESLWCKAWQLRWKLQQTVVFNIWDDFASLTYARHKAECKWLWVGANYFSLTLIPTGWLNSPQVDSERQANGIGTFWKSVTEIPEMCKRFFFEHSLMSICSYTGIDVRLLSVSIITLTIGAEDLFVRVCGSAHHLWPFLCCSVSLLRADEKF